MNQEQRKFLADKLGTLGNIAMAALVFAQFVAEKPWRPALFVFGVLLFFICYLLGYVFLKGGE